MNRGTLIIFCAIILMSCNTNNKGKTVTSLKNDTVKLFDTTQMHTEKTLKDSSKNESWNFDSVVGKKLFFSKNRSFTTDLFDVKYIGQIELKNKHPYLIISGRACDECDLNVALYVHSPSDGPLETDYGANRYPYPGTEKDGETGKIVQKIRTFYGQISDTIQGIIWFESVLQVDSSFKDVILLSYLNGDSLIDTMYENKKQLSITLNLLKQQKCKEIKGTSYYSEP